MGPTAAPGGTQLLESVVSPAKGYQGASSKVEVLGARGYVWIKQLGCGQYGTAHLVRKEDRDEEPVVAKVVFLDHLKDRDRALALQEVELLRRLRHPNIVRFHESWLHHCAAGIEGQEALASVMEYCAGGDLRDWLEARAKAGGYLTEEAVLSLFAQMLEGLRYIHQQHILHRDLKTSNMLLDGDHHTVKIGDFGIARVLENPTAEAITMLGTPYYMSPEVCKGEPYRDKTDMWSLGCVLYEMCVLRHAFESQSLLGLVYCIVSERFEPIPANRYSPALSELVGWLLKKSAEERPSADEVFNCDILISYVSRTPVAVSADASPGTPAVLHSSANSPPAQSTSLWAASMLGRSRGAEAKLDVRSPLRRSSGRRSSAPGPPPPAEPTPKRSFYGSLPPVEVRPPAQVAVAVGFGANSETKAVPLQSSASQPVLPPLRRPAPPTVQRPGSSEGFGGSPGGHRVAKTQSSWRPDRTAERFTSPSRALVASATAASFGIPALAATAGPPLTAVPTPKSRPSSRPRTTSTVSSQSPRLPSLVADMNYVTQVLLTRIRRALLKKPRARASWVQAFALHDTTGRGVLGSAEFAPFLESLALGMIRREVCIITDHLASDGGTVSLGGFNEAVMHASISDTSFDEAWAKHSACALLSHWGMASLAARGSSGTGNAEELSPPLTLSDAERLLVWLPKLEAGAVDWPAVEEWRTAIW